MCSKSLAPFDSHLHFKLRFLLEEEGRRAEDEEEKESSSFDRLDDDEERSSAGEDRRLAETERDRREIAMAVAFAQRLGFWGAQ